MIAQAGPAGRVELADIVRAHAGQLTRLSPTQQHVLQAIADCRTAALGGHRRACAQCGHQEIASNSCRDRHCPTCQGLEAMRWVEPDTWEATLLRLTGKDVTRCPCCGTGGFLIVAAVPARAEPGDVPSRVRNPRAILPFVPSPWS